MNSFNDLPVPQPVQCKNSHPTAPDPQSLRKHWWEPSLDRPVQIIPNHHLPDCNLHLLYREESSWIIQYSGVYHTRRVENLLQAKLAKRTTAHTFPIYCQQNIIRVGILEFRSRRKIQISLIFEYTENIFFKQPNRFPSIPLNPENQERWSEHRLCGGANLRW